MKDLLNMGRVIRACRFSWQGLSHAARHEPAFRQELAVAAVALPVAIYLGQSNVEKALLAASIGLFQNDIKKVLAYSTVSQLGYMFVALGAGLSGAPTTGSGALSVSTSNWRPTAPRMVRGK